MSKHPDPSQIVALAHAVGRKLREGVLTHVASCPECAAVLAGALGEMADADRERKMLRFGRVTARREPPQRSAGLRPRVWWARPRAGVGELAAAEALLAELLSEPDAKQAMLVHNSDRFGGLALAELVLEEARQACFDDAARGERLAHLGLALLERLDRDYYGRRILDDVRGRGYAFLGNAHRILDDHEAAAASLRRASELLTDTPDPVEMAGLLSLQAGLAKDQRRFDDALELLSRAAELYEAAGEETKAGRAYASQGSVLLDRGEPEAADVALSEALVRLDAEEDPRTLVYVRHNLVLCLADLERYEEAAELLGQLEDDYAQFPETHTRTRMRWVRGKILAGTGRDEEAEQCFRETRAELLEHGSPNTAANVSLDLALLLLRQGRSAELKSLAAEMTPVFFARDIARETSVALAFFARAVEKERATAMLIKRVAGFLRRAESDPKLKFSEYS